MSHPPVKEPIPPLGLDDFIAAVERAMTAANASTAAQALASEILSATAAWNLDLLLSSRPEQLARVLSSLLVHAPFFGPMLRQRPAWLLELAATDLSRPCSAAEMRQQLSLVLEAVEDDAGERLRHFKYRQLARITVRELSTDLVPDVLEPEILGEISALADTLLEAALHLADQRLRARLGLASAAEALQGFVVLGLGKLGAGELNYSSDVDLIYVFDGDAAPEALGLGDRLAPVEYFTRLAQELGKLVSVQAADGFLYRIDIELRPEGKQGPLVIAGSAFVQYYDTWAATWERAAAMKARPVAGDSALGWKVIRALAPMLYRSSVDYESIAAIHDLKSRSAEVRAEAEVFDVKYGRGGIRDVETIAQALQLVHGGQMPQVRQRSTEAAIQALEGVGVLDPSDAASLRAAYRFLRRLEHRIQMYAERQTYVLPSAADDLERLARSFGWSGDDPALQLRSTLGQHRDAVSELMRRLFPEDTADRVMSFFASRMPGLLANTPTRDAMSELADHFAREIEGGPNPQRALNNLERFIAGVGHRRSYYELLLDRPELVPRLATLFATSEHLSGYLATYPRLIEPIFNDPNVLLLTREQLGRNFDDLEKELIAESGGADTETQLDTLRLFHHRELVNVGLLDLVDKVTRSEAETALTEIAEVCLERALGVARRQLAQRPLPHAEARFLVVGMGKAASLSVRRRLRPRHRLRRQDQQGRPGEGRSQPRPAAAPPRIPHRQAGRRARPRQGAARGGGGQEGRGGRHRTGDPRGPCRRHCARPRQGRDPDPRRRHPEPRPGGHGRRERRGGGHGLP